MTNNNTPFIIRETSSGEAVHTIQDEMFLRREVEYVGEVDAESAASICRQLLQLYREDPEKEITMYINSPGGEVLSGLAVIDVMKAISCPVRTVCMGRAYSMGADPGLSGVSGSTGSIQETSRRMLKLRDVTNGLLAEHTGKSLKEINKKTAKDCYFSAQEAVEFGLADRVIDRL